jgi:hemerythrin-like domain-containing protein
MAETAQPEAHQSEMPKLSAADFRAYNRMAQHMNQFHSSFRATWKMLYASCSSGKRPANMSLRQFISTAEQFLHHLEMHHSIEERHIFPVRYALAVV